MIKRICCVEIVVFGAMYMEAPQMRETRNHKQTYLCFFFFSLTGIDVVYYLKHKLHLIQQDDRLHL